MRPGQLGIPFRKFTGSGNDFVFFDTRTEPLVERYQVENAKTIAAICARGSGVGADGVVFVVADPAGDLGIRYYNADGTRASLCGNASLCTARFAAEERVGGKLTGDVRVATDAGLITARVGPNDRPEIDLDPVTGLVADQRVTAAPAAAKRIGFAVVGVPHLVVLVDDVAAIDIVGLGRPLRRDAALGAEGANVNFVSVDGGRRRMRTYERGVENETLACGTGTVATAALLRSWGLAPADATPTWLEAPGGALGVRFAAGGQPSLLGEGRLVFEGVLPVLPLG